MRDVCRSFSGNVSCGGINALACDVDVELVMDRACNGECTTVTSEPLTSLDFTGVSGQSVDLSTLAVFLGAIPSMMGPYTYGAQPMYSVGRLQPNSSYALPIAFSDVTAPGTFYHFTQANLTNYINVTAGALAIYQAQAWPQGWTIVESTSRLARMDVRRSWALLAPPGIALIAVIFLASLSAFMHRQAGIREYRLGGTIDIFEGSESGVLSGFLATYTPKATLAQLKLRYGKGSGESADRIGLRVEGEE